MRSFPKKYEGGRQKITHVEKKPPKIVTFSEMGLNTEKELLLFVCVFQAEPLKGTREVTPILDDLRKNNTFDKFFASIYFKYRITSGCIK